MSGADLANLCNEAALMAARRNARTVEMQDFESAKDKIIMGPERKSMVMPEESVAIRLPRGRSRAHRQVVARAIPCTRSPSSRVGVPWASR